MPRPFSLSLMQLYATPCLALYWHQVLQRGAAPSLNLAVCPAAARSPARSAKVPHPSLCGWPSCGGQCQVGCAGKPTHNSSQPWRSPPLPGTRNRKPPLVAMRPSPPWCNALALSNSIRCKMQQDQTAKGARQWQCPAISKQLGFACSQRPLLRAPA
jgi:hypothetical protein